MNFLEIVQKVNKISGVQGTVTSVNDTGYQATIVEIVKDAWIDIQNLRPNFNFFQQDTTFNTVASQTEYTINDVFGTTTDPVSSYRGFLYGTDPLRVITKEEYILGDFENLPPTIPSVVAVDPLNNHLWFSPTDAIYPISVYYFAKVQDLVLDADIPICPREFHNAIVYRAAADTAAFFGNQTLYQTYTQRASTMIGSLMRSQNPAIAINISGRTV